MSDRTPSSVWRELAAGNGRFAADGPSHPRQDAARRGEVADAQHPKAVIFGCSDSRVAAELLFDQGLGDLFVVRNAGHVLDGGALASIEYGVGVLGASLVVVLEHQFCGAVRAAVDQRAPGSSPLPVHIGAHVAAIEPAVDAVRAAHPDEPIDAEAVGLEHLQRTVGALLEASTIISASVADGSVAVVGAQYRLSEGAAVRRFTIGEV